LEISKQCSVDVSGFDASRYFRSEPSFMSLFWFLPSQKRNRVDQKAPLTVGELVDAARCGKLFTSERP